MTALRSNGVRTIIIGRLDRLARELMVQEAPLRNCRSKALLWYPSRKDVMSFSTRIAFRQMMGFFAQYDKRQIVLKLKAARNA